MSTIPIIVVSIILLFALALWVYKTYLEDIFSFVVETNDDVEEFKNTIIKNNEP